MDFRKKCSVASGAKFKLADIDPGHKGDKAHSLRLPDTSKRSLTCNTSSTLRVVDRLWEADEPADVARLQVQARLIAVYEEAKWPPRPPSKADLIRHLMDQHDLTRADMVPILGMPSRVSEVLQGKKGLSMAMVQRLRARFHVPADPLLPLPKKAPVSRQTKRAAA